MVASMASPVQLLGPALFREVLEGAKASPRLRLNYNFHEGPDDNPHRFLNVMLRGTYVRPHRHVTPPKAEVFLVLEGELAFFLFDDAGTVTATHTLRAGDPEGSMGIDFGPGVWHSLAVLSDHAVCYEVKPGPWKPATDKDFAPWAPAEGDPDAHAYLTRLLAHL